MWKDDAINVELIRQMKKDILQLAYKAKEGHIASAYSILDILWVLYNNIMDTNKILCGDASRDRFILSKGHAAVGLYVVLEKVGLITRDQLYSFCKYDSCLGGHPDCNKISAVEASTGSLGHGLSIAVGMALAAKIKKEKQSIYVLVGDGELNEGSMWEAIMLATQHNLDNLCCIVDYNHSTDRALNLGKLTEKFNAFGWNTIEIDGHNHHEIFDAVITENSERPKAIIANTIKGKGIEAMENNPEWHHKFPNIDEYNSMVSELSR